MCNEAKVLILSLQVYQFASIHKSHILTYFKDDNMNIKRNFKSFLIPRPEASSLVVRLPKI